MRLKEEEEGGEVMETDRGRGGGHALRCAQESSVCEPRLQQQQQ